MKEFEEIKFTEAQILSLQPSDILVLRMKGRISEQAYAHLRDSLKTVVLNKVLILEDDAELSVVRLEEAK